MPVSCNWKTAGIISFSSWKYDHCLVLDLELSGRFSSPLLLLCNFLLRRRFPPTAIVGVGTDDSSPPVKFSEVGVGIHQDSFFIFFPQVAKERPNSCRQSHLSKKRRFTDLGVIFWVWRSKGYSATLPYKKIFGDPVTAFLTPLLTPPRPTMADDFGHCLWTTRCTHFLISGILF